MTKILFFTGCSGAGKTKLVEMLWNNLNQHDLVTLHFDSIAIPTIEDMINLYRSAENWQRITTQIWVDKMLAEYSNKKLILFEGQVDLLFIETAFSKHNFSNYQIILVHCSNKERHKRLINKRNQIELVNDQMDNWANYLYNQAQEKNAYILDTTNKSLQELVILCKEQFRI